MGIPTFLHGRFFPGYLPARTISPYITPGHFPEQIPCPESSPKHIPGCIRWRSIFGWIPILAKKQTRFLAFQFGSLQSQITNALTAAMSKWFRRMPVAICRSWYDNCVAHHLANCVYFCLCWVVETYNLTFCGSHLRCFGVISYTVTWRSNIAQLLAK